MSAAGSVWKGVTYDSKGKVLSCLFCNICERIEPATIVHSNDKFVAFIPLRAVTSSHILVSPREHITNFYSLRGNQDAEMVEEMVKVFVPFLRSDYL
jgi:diadenosine tetraphosphate (Ap4A) HIT family hydrolase